MLIYKCASTCPDNNGQNPAQIIVVDNWADIDGNGVKAGSLGKGGVSKSDEFLEKFQKGGGGHFQSKNLCCRFLPL